MVTGFDPLIVASRGKAPGLRLAIDEGRAAFAPDGIGRGGQLTVEALLPLWLVGAGTDRRAELAEALAWLEEGADPGEEADPIDALLQRRALGIGRWLLVGKVDRRPWAEAVRLGEKVLKAEAPAPYLLSDHMLDCLLAGEVARAEAAPAAYPADDDVAEVEAALALAKGDAAAAVGRLYRARIEDWLAERIHRRTAAWAMAAWYRTGLAGTPEAAMLALYAFLDDVPVAPALAARGWRDAGAEPVQLVREGGVALERLDDIATAFGLLRDPDQGTAPGDELFASWTGPMGDTGELDYEEEDGVARLELRGRRAAMRGNALMELIDAHPG